MKPTLRLRLSLIFVTQYFAAGAWIVSLGSYMSKTLGFDSIIAIAYSMVGFATIAATLFVGVIADRYFDARKVLAALSLGSSATLFWLSEITQSHTVFLTAMLVHCMFYISSIPLLATIAFNAISNPGQQYPGIRVFGSVGWIVAGLLVGMIPGAGKTNLPMLIGAGTYLTQSLYALTLPHTPPRARGQSITIAGLFGFDILGQVRNASFWIFIGCVVFVVIPKKFYDSFTNNFLVEKGMSFSFGDLIFEPTAIQTLGQIAEIPTMLLIPFLIARIGIKNVMILGMIGWVGRFILFAYGFHADQAIGTMLLIGILMHGVSYDFFFVAGQIYLDRLFDPAMRARVQAFYWFILSGVGVVFGSLIANGVYRAFSAGSAAHDWTAIWLVPACITAVVAALFAWRFKEGVPIPDSATKSIGRDGNRLQDS